jgi:hypothetical protein
MPTTTYTDGFPQNPVEAIDFSYFLSDEEKQDWKNWLESATPEQQYELVDTLHAMWQENQKSAIPDGFSQGSSNNQPTSSVQSDSQTEVNDTKQANLVPVTNPAPVVTDQNSEDSTLNTINDEPIAWDDPQTKVSQNVQPPQNSPKKEIKQPTKQKVKDQEDNLGEEDENFISSPTNGTKKRHFNVTKLRESATKQELETLYNEYLSLRETNYDNTHAYMEAQGKFLDKIMSVVINFEQVGDFFDSISERMIELNDKIVSQVKEYNTIKGGITTQHSDLVDQVEHLRNDVDRLYRTTKDDKSYNRVKFEEINTQLATLGADSYNSGDGLLQRIDLISSKLHNLELKFTRSSSQNSNLNIDQTRQALLTPQAPRTAPTPPNTTERPSNGTRTNISINSR